MCSVSNEFQKGVVLNKDLTKIFWWIFLAGFNQKFTDFLIVFQYFIQPKTRISYSVVAATELHFDRLLYGGCLETELALPKVLDFIIRPIEQSMPHIRFFRSIFIPLLYNLQPGPKLSDPKIALLNSFNAFLASKKPSETQTTFHWQK